MTRSLIESTALSTVSLVSRCPKQSVQRLHSLTMVDNSKSPSPDKLSPLPEGESLLSQPNSDAQGQLTAAVDDLLNELQSKFDNVSTEMFGKLDDMTKRLDELEASLAASSSAGAPSQAK
ncbi:hypothetical protein N7527_002410 [Penicillium freii]|uniref:Heat shock factor binding protein 1 n=1 Tax=Penicillium freii TaxID=48697 RepID=A0A101MNC3_PENFR|nr:hypothetical protein N7527_002410 [Penicillium freii]KUM63655.1 hypothetical protein ACN42_g3418 [Penicillium freii]